MEKHWPFRAVLNGKTGSARPEFWPKAALRNSPNAVIPVEVARVAAAAATKAKLKWVAIATRLKRQKRTVVPSERSSDDVGMAIAAEALAPLTTTTVAPALRAGASKKPGGLLKSAHDDKPDTLSAIGGVGNALVKKMNVLGIYHFGQIARLTKAEQAWLGEALGFPGRPERENWTGEARRMAEGNESTAVKPAKRAHIKSKK